MNMQKIVMVQLSRVVYPVLKALFANAVGLQLVHIMGFIIHPDHVHS